MSLTSCFTCGHRRTLLVGTGSSTSSNDNNDDDAAAAAQKGDHQDAESKKKLQPKGEKKLVFFGESKDSPPLELDDLLSSSAEVLGRGSFGATYKADLEDIGMVVTVKRLKGSELIVDDAEFVEKLETIAAIDHPNLVPLRAFHSTPREKLLLYDYMSMGSLSSLLHGKRESCGSPALMWTTRLNIALTAARGVEYIHSMGPTSCHANIKSSNVLFADDFDARVSDHSISLLAKPFPFTNHLAGYRAPEITAAAAATSQKADVYSFGILLLELVTGNDPVRMAVGGNDGALDLAARVSSIPREDWLAEVIDESVIEEVIAESVDGKEEMVMLLELALDCCASCPDDRPTMSDVVRRIVDLR